MLPEIDFSQVLENFRAFSADAKSSNNIIKLIGHITAGVSSIEKTHKNYKVEKDFEQIYHLNDFHLVEKRMDSVTKVNKEDLLSAHYLVCALFFKYRVKSLFKEIRIIGNNGQLNGLTMDDYYIELSYLDRSKIKIDADLLIIEKEGNTTKKRKRSRTELYSNYLSANNVSEALVINFEQSVIVGNPGVGKSTFSRWLCHQWARQEVKVPFILLYLNLRELDFNTTNPILDYIIHEYTPNCKDNPLSLERVLRNFSFDFKYILDGLDEIDQVNKVKLEKSLRRLTNNSDFPPFILLSRPYGLRNTIFQSVRHFNEILGFNEAQREGYIKNVLVANPQNQKSTSNFLKLIEGNLVLKDISYNPLMLSYMVLMYLNGDEKIQTMFGEIYSPYQLQDIILGLLMQYHQRDKHMNESYYINRLEESKMISGEMELAKEFVYQNRSNRDIFQKSALLLSELGVGRYDSANVGNGWQFYFSSITFQEFLAAEQFGKSLTPEAFVYLFGDTFFWNFSKMLLGWLSLNNKTSTIEGIFDLLETRFKGSGNLLYYQRLKYPILSELSPSFIQQRIKDIDLSQMVEMAYWAMFDDLRGELYIDSVHKIYLKLNKKQQEYFKSFIPYYLSFFLDLNSTEHQKIDFPDSIIHLIKNLNLTADAKIVKCLLDWLDKYHLKSEEIWKKIEPQVFNEEMDFEFEGSEEERLLDTYDFSMIEIYGVLKTAKREQLLLFRNRLEMLIENYPDSLEDRSLELMMRIYNTETHLQNAIDHYEYSKMTFEKNLVKSEKDDFTDPKMVILSRVCVGLATAFSGHSHEDKIPVVAILNKVNQLFIAYANSDFCMPDERDSIYTNFVDALKNINEPQFFNLLFTYISEYEIPSLFNVTRPNDFLSYVDQIIENLDNSKDIISEFKRLLFAFQSTTLGRLSIYKYREAIFEILEAIVNVNYDSLNGFFLKDNGDGEQEKLTSQLAELLNHVNHTFTYPYDRKFLIEQYKRSELIDNNYIKWRHIPIILKEDISFSEEWIWLYIQEELMEKKNLFEKVIDIMDNELLYNIPSNFSSIQTIWTKLFSIQYQPYFQVVFEKKSSTIFSGLYYLLVNFGRNNTSPENKSIIEKIGLWLKKNTVRDKFFSSSNLNQLEIHKEAVALYPLCSMLLNDLDLQPPKSLHHLLFANTNLYRRVSSELLSIFQFDLDHLKNFIPKEVHDQIIAYNILDNEVNYTLDKTHFLSLLKK